MLEYFTPENKKYDNDYHKQVRAQSQKTVISPDNKEFTMEEISNVVEGMDKKMRPKKTGLLAKFMNL